VVEYVLRLWPSDDECAPVAGTYERSELVANTYILALDAVAALNGGPPQASPASTANRISWLLDVMAAQDDPAAIAPLEGALSNLMPHSPRGDLKPDGIEVDAIMRGKSLLPIERAHREATGIAGIESITNDLPFWRIAETDVTVLATEVRYCLLTKCGLDYHCKQEAEEP